MRKSLFIGIGGTGINTILYTKKAILDSFGTIPSEMAFLVVDTDEGALRHLLSSNGKEIVLSPNEELRLYVVERVIAYFEAFRRNMSWFPLQNVSAIPCGNSSPSIVRTNGRLRFLMNREVIKNSLIRTLREIGGNDTIEVNVVFSLCGGTGSGMFIDMAYLLREIAKEHHLSLSINAYAAMPEAFRLAAGRGIGSYRMRANSYAALKELDYLMSAPRNGITIKLPWKEEEVYEAPFDSVNLIDISKDNRLEYRVYEIQEIISVALLASIGLCVRSGDSIGQQIKNEMISGNYDIANQKAWVTAIGATAIEYDGNRVARVYECMAQNELIIKLLTLQTSACTLYEEWLKEEFVLNNNKDIVNYFYDFKKIGLPKDFSAEIKRNNVKQITDQVIDNYFREYLPEREHLEAILLETINSIKQSIDHLISTKCQKSFALVSASLNLILEQVMMLLESNKSNKIEGENKLSITHKKLEKSKEELEQYMQRLFSFNKKAYVEKVQNSARGYLIAKMNNEIMLYVDRLYLEVIQYVDAELKICKDKIEKLKQIRTEHTRYISLEINHFIGHKTTIDIAENEIKEIKFENQESLQVDTKLWEALTAEDMLSIEKIMSILNTYTAQLPQVIAYREKSIDSIIERIDEEQLNNLIERVNDYSYPSLKLNDKLEQGGYGYTPNHLYYINDIGPGAVRLINQYIPRMVNPHNFYRLRNDINDRVIILHRTNPMPLSVVAEMEQLKDEYEMGHGCVAYLDENWHEEMQKEGFI